MTFHAEAADDFLDLESTLSSGPKGYVVVHPLHDVPETKVDLDQLGPMRLTRGCRLALVSLRCYLIGIMAMGAWRMVEWIRH